MRIWPSVSGNRSTRLDPVCRIGQRERSRCMSLFAEVRRDAYASSSWMVKASPAEMRVFLGCAPALALSVAAAATERERDMLLQPESARPSKPGSLHCVPANNDPLAAFSRWMDAPVWWSLSGRASTKPAAPLLYLEKGTLACRDVLSSGDLGPGTWLGLFSCPRPSPVRARSRERSGVGSGGEPWRESPWPCCETGRRPVTWLEQDNSAVKNFFWGARHRGLRD